MPFNAVPGNVTVPPTPARPLPSMDTKAPEPVTIMRRLTVPPTSGLPKPAHDTFAGASVLQTTPLAGAVMNSPEEGVATTVTRGLEL